MQRKPLELFERALGALHAPGYKGASHSNTKNVLGAQSPEETPAGNVLLHYIGGVHAVALALRHRGIELPGVIAKVELKAKLSEIYADVSEENPLTEIPSSEIPSSIRSNRARPVFFDNPHHQKHAENLANTVDSALRRLGNDAQAVFAGEMALKYAECLVGDGKDGIELLSYVLAFQKKQVQIVRRLAEGKGELRQTDQTDDDFWLYINDAIDVLRSPELHVVRHLPS